MWGLVLVISFFVAVVIFLTLDFQVTPNLSMKDIYTLFYVVVAFGMSIIWIFLLADEMISLLRTLGIIIGVSEAVLGLVILGMTNSLGDLVANSSIARVSPAMAIAACYGSPLLTWVFGLGLPVMYSWMFSSISVISFAVDLKIAVGFGVVFSALLITMVWVSSNNFTMTSCFGITLLMLYISFIIFCIVIEFWLRIDFKIT